MSSDTSQSFVSGSLAASLNDEVEETQEENTRLAERTSQLMSSYRDYISEVDLDVKGYKPSDYRQNALTNTGPVIRDRNSASEAAAVSSPNNEVPFGSSDAASLIDDYSFSFVDTTMTARKYKHPIFHSKKCKRLLFTVVVAACALVGVVVGVKKQMRPTTLPDWDQELKEVLEEEEPVTVEEGVHWPAPDQEESLENEGGIASDSKAPDTVATSTEGQIGSILHQQFKPLWLGANEGWHGGSHDDAIQFCESVRGRKVCPYAAICPQGDGANAIVMGGRHAVEFKVEEEQYAPVFGKGNNWVMIGEKDGDPSAKCKTYHQLERTNPAWGLTNERGDLKKHIMCCNFD